MISEDEINI